MSDNEVIEFYNNRGGSERLFDEMNNDFIWTKDGSEKMRNIVHNTEKS